MKQIEQHASKDVAKVLVGNKADRDDKQIDYDTGKQLADEYGLEFFETSAKTGQNVSELFQHIAHNIIKDKKKPGAGESGGSRHTLKEKTDKDGKSDKKGCC